MYMPGSSSCTSQLHFSHSAPIHLDTGDTSGATGGRYAVMPPMHFLLSLFQDSTVVVDDMHGVSASQDKADTWPMSSTSTCAGLHCVGG